jgi:hypothetical protein
MALVSIKFEGRGQPCGPLAAALASDFQRFHTKSGELVRPKDKEAMRLKDNEPCV